MPEAQLLLTDHQLSKECLDYVAIPGIYSYTVQIVESDYIYIQ